MNMPKTLSAGAVVLAAAWAALAQATAPGPATRPAPAVTSRQAQQAEEKSEEARRLFFRKQYLQAIELLKEAAALDPGKTAYRLLLAKAHRHAGQTDQAAAVLEAVLKDNPEHVDAGIELADILSPARQPDRVIAILQPLLKFKHDYPLYHMLAEAYQQKEQWPLAREHYEEAVRLNPASPDDWYQLGNVHLLQTRFARAAEAYEKAGALGVDTAVYHFKLASVYFNLRNYLGVVAAAQVLGGAAGQIKNDLYLIEPVPGQKDSFYVARPRSAIFHVAKARQLGIDTPQIRFLEANIWLSARRFARADALYKELEGKLEKSDLGLFYYYWSQTAMGMDDYDAHIARLKKAIEVEPELYKATLADAYVAVAGRYQQRGDNERYIRHLLLAVDASPLSAALHLALGEAYWQAGRRKDAAEQYRLTLEIEPDHADRIRLLNRIREAHAAAAPATAPAAG